MSLDLAPTIMVITAAAGSIIAAKVVLSIPMFLKALCGRVEPWN